MIEDNDNGNQVTSIEPLTLPDLPDVTYTSVDRFPNPGTDFSTSTVGNFISALPSVEDLHKNSRDLFRRIKSGDHGGVERILSDKGHKVEIIPKIGCSPLHYSKLNLANWETENGDNPLIMAAMVDNQMVKIILKYGGNPNHTNNDRETPLSIAAGRCDQETIGTLLLAGANLRAAVVKLTSLLKYILSDERLSGHSDLANSVIPLTVLLSDDVYLKCRSPIKTAFDVARDIADIKNVRDEFKIEFELLIEDANLFAYQFLNNIDRMWEARKILTFPVDLIRMATDQKKKKFVSHPFSQQIVYDRWYGDLARKMFYGKTVVALKFFISPFMALPLFFKFFLFDVCRGVPVMESNLASLLRLKFTPFLCFITDALNYIIFLASLIAVCLTEQDTGKVTPWEYALYVCVISRIFIELDLVVQQGWRRYFANVWNHVDILILTLLLIAALYKICINGNIQHMKSHKEIEKKLEMNSTQYATLNESYKLDDWSVIISHYRHFLNISYIYAVTEFVLFLRMLTLLEGTRSMGPMMIALKYLLADVLKFSVLLMTTIMGTSIAIYSMSLRLEKWSSDINLQCDSVTNKDPGPLQNFKQFIKELTDAEQINNINTTNLCDGTIDIEPPPSLDTLTTTIRSIMWSTFGLFDVENVTKPYEESTISFINFVLVLYILLSCVLLLNMLIGILSSTFDRIQENCDIEWKYVRSESLKEYSTSQPFLIPFSTILFPLVYWFRRKLREEKLKETEKFSNPAAQQEERDKIISEVCKRYKFDLAGITQRTSVHLDQEQDNMIILK